MTRLDTFTAAYLLAALWSSTDDGGAPLDRDHTIADLAPETIRDAERDCAAFRETYGASLDASGAPEAQHGHDFWLTRNRHGAGFWDRGYPKAVSDALTAGAHGFGELDLYIGDDGQIYGA